MRLKAACLFCLLVGLSITVAGLAQEGHPLVGTWYGDWGRKLPEAYRAWKQRIEK